jgi:hypothetical protein
MEADVELQIWVLDRLAWGAPERTAVLKVKNTGVEMDLGAVQVSNGPEVFATTFFVSLTNEMGSDSTSDPVRLQGMAFPDRLLRLSPRPVLRGRSGTRGSK